MGSLVASGSEDESVMHTSKGRSSPARNFPAGLRGGSQPVRGPMAPDLSVYADTVLFHAGIVGMGLDTDWKGFWETDRFVQCWPGA